MATKNVKGVKRADGNTYLYVDQAARTKIGTATLTTTAQDLSGAVNELESGKADLDSGGKIPAAQLPSYVDDVLEYANKASFPATGESGKIYVDLATNKTYRWSGTAYVEISESLALGETSSTAYAGNKGKANADAIAVLNGTGTGSVSKTVSDAIATLDVASVGGAGKYISAISEADGKISATAETMDAAPTEGSLKAVTSGGIKTAIDDSVSLKTATGNPITLTDAANANAEELSMTIEPIQSGSGDPSPTNVRPISGLTEGKVFDYGENLVDITRLTSNKQEQGITLTLNGDGSVTANGTATGRCQIYWVIPNNLATKFAGKILSGNPSIDNCSLILELDGSPYTTYATDTGEGGVISNDIASVSAPTGVSLIWRIQAGVTLDHVTITPRITDAATATITFGQTVYGGSVNFKTGEVTVTHGMVDLGTLTDWEYAGRGVDNGYIYKIASFTTIPRKLLNCVGFSNKLFQSNFTSYSSTKINSFNLGHWTVSLFVGSTFDTLDDFKTAMSGVQLCYELATPTTLTLTPAELELLKGNNTVSGNGAEISIEYYPDNAIGALAERVDDMPTALSDLTDDATHRTVTDTEKSTWNGKMGTPVVYEDSSSTCMAFTNGSMVGYFSNGTRYIKGGADENGIPYIQLWKAGYDSVKLSNTKALFKVYNHQLEFGIDGIVGSGNGANYTVNLSQTKLSYLNNITSDVQAQIDTKVEIQNNAGFHNSIYRGKFLGSEVTAEQWASISAGTFDDMYIGDYWTIGGVNYRIAHFDYWLNTGDTNCTTHHVVLVPDTNLYTAKMNDSNTTAGAYVGSKMYTTNLAQAKTTINNAFGASHILNHREYLANAMKATADPTYESAGSWYDSTVELMNERMVYGADVFHNVEVNGEIPFNYTIDKSQLALFALDPSRICNRAAWWLRCAMSAARFAIVDYNGLANWYSASNAFGVHPAFGIKA